MKSKSVLALFPSLAFDTNVVDATDDSAKNAGRFERWMKTGSVPLLDDFYDGGT